VQFTGSESEIDLNLHTPEFSRHTWMPLEELPERVVDFKRSMYSEVVRHFAHHIPRLEWED
jgi:putative (di)nucleoside polyphosphate hydrolase